MASLDSTSSRPPLRVASLFSGCGGLDLGFTGGFNAVGSHYQRLPTRVVFANDFDPDAANCYNANGSLTGDGCECLLADIREVPLERIPDFDILLAGFPCQPFSNAGSRRGVNDARGRGTLFEQCERILRGKIEAGAKPNAFVFENVRGILSSRMPDGTTVPAEIHRRMEALGYHVSQRLVCAADYGVPQMRYRVLIVGVAKEVGRFDFEAMDEVVRECDLPSLAQDRSERLMLGSVLQGVEAAPDNEVWAYSSGAQRMIDLIGPCAHGPGALDLFRGHFRKEDLPEVVFRGRSWKDIPPDKLTPRFRRIHDDPKRYHSPKFYRRFAYGEINGTVIASAQPENSGITHPVQNRRFTVREIARLQSFPDDYRFDAIPLQSRYKVIGNAVPPVLGWVVARALLRVVGDRQLRV